MQLTEISYFKSGLPKDVKFIRGEDSVVLRTSIVTHSSNGDRRLIISMDVEVNNQLLEHISSSTNGNDISIYCVNKSGDVIEHSLDEVPDVIGLNELLNGGTIGELFGVPIDFFDYIPDALSYFPKIRKFEDEASVRVTNGDGESVIDLRRDIVPYKDDAGRVLWLLCAASPIATGACILGVLIFLSVPKAY